MKGASGSIVTTEPSALPSIDPFYAIGLSVLARRLESEGAKIIHMEFGQPSTGAPAAVAPALRANDMSMPSEMSSGTSEEPP